MCLGVHFRISSMFINVGWERNSVDFIVYHTKRGDHMMDIKTIGSINYKQNVTFLHFFVFGLNCLLQNWRLVLIVNWRMITSRPTNYYFSFQWLLWWSGWWYSAWRLESRFSEDTMVVWGSPTPSPPSAPSCLCAQASSLWSKCGSHVSSESRVGNTKSSNRIFEAH